MPDQRRGPGSRLHAFGRQDKRLWSCRAATGVRVDSHIYCGYEIPVHYDSLLAKLIVWGADRDEAIIRGERAFDEFRVEGMPTTVSLHKKILAVDAFRRGDVDTDFIPRYLGT